MSKSTTLAIEIDNRNNNVDFRPLQKKIRSRFSLSNCREPNAMKLHSQWPDIPGQHLELDLSSGEISVVDPLHEQQFAALREKIEATGKRLPPERETFAADVPTCLYHLRELVKTNKAKLLSGEFPPIDESKVQRRFHSTERPGAEDRLVAAIETQNKLLAELVAKLGK